jgi:hypothetical protein
VQEGLVLKVLLDEPAGGPQAAGVPRTDFGLVLGAGKAEAGDGLVERERVELLQEVGELVQDTPHLLVSQQPCIVFHLDLKTIGVRGDVQDEVKGVEAG